MARSSSIFWFASSAHEVAQSRAVLRAMKPQGVLDEMGFLVLLGAISDRLYPGISTVMTRARYFIFVPAIYRHIEERGLAKGKNAEDISRNLQIRLCLALMGTDSQDAGIIGKRHHGDVVRLPSSIYWSALSEFGISTRATSESSYLASLSKRAAHRHTIVDDDRVRHETEADGLWCRRIPTAGLIDESGDFAAGTSLPLSRAEATYLRDRMLGNDPHNAPSLLGHLLRSGSHTNHIGGVPDYPWTVQNLSAELQRITDHARRLSLFARGAQLQYDALLFEKRGVEDPGTLDAFSRWWEYSADSLASWDYRDFWDMACVRNAMRDAAFLRTWRDAIVSARSPQLAYSSMAARHIILEREWYLRGNKARFRSKFHLEEWQPPTNYDPNAHYRLTFRQAIGSRIIADISEPLQPARR